MIKVTRGITQSISLISDEIGDGYSTYSKAVKIYNVVKLFAASSQLFSEADLFIYCEISIVHTDYNYFFIIANKYKLLDRRYVPTTKSQIYWSKYAKN